MKKVVLTFSESTKELMKKYLKEYTISTIDNVWAELKSDIDKDKEEVFSITDSINGLAIESSELCKLGDVVLGERFKQLGISPHFDHCFQKYFYYLKDNIGADELNDDFLNDLKSFLKVQLGYGERTLGVEFREITDEIAWIEEQQANR